MDTTQKLSRAVEVVAEKAGEVAPHAWEVMVRRQVTEGALGLSLSLVALAASVLALIACWRWRSERHPKNVFSIPAFTVGVVLFPLGVIGSFNNAIHLINPEYYAAVELLEALR